MGDDASIGINIRPPFAGRPLLIALVKVAYYAGRSARVIAKLC